MKPSKNCETGSLPSERLVRALESGRYLQGLEFLRFDDGFKQRYTVLGVATDLAAQEGVVNWQAMEGRWWQAVDQDGAIGSPFEPPDAVYEWLGITDANTQMELMGDNVYHTFETVAEKMRAGVYHGC